MGLFLEEDAGNLEGIEYLPDAMGSSLDARYTCASQFKRLLQSIAI